MRMVFSDLLGISGRTRRFDRQLRDAHVARGSRVASARVRALRHHPEYHPEDHRDLSSARALRDAYGPTGAAAGSHSGEVQTRLLRAARSILQRRMPEPLAPAFSLPYYSLPYY